MLVTGCAPKPKQAKTKINITPSMAIANINMNGGAIVYGQKTDGAGSWAKVFRPGQNVVVDMTYGTWNFSIFAYDGANGELTGAIECSAINGVNIGEENEVVDMKIDLAQCAGAGARRVDLNLCTGAQFTAVTGGTVASCNQSATGIRSWRMRVLGHRGGALNGEFLQGPCIVEADYTGGSLNRRFPSGLGNVSMMPVEFVAYTTTDCSGAEAVIPFKYNLAKPSSPSIKIFENINVLNMVANLQGSGLDLIAPTVTIVSTAPVTGNGESWINAANQNSYGVNGTCETGLTVDFYMNNISTGDTTVCTSGTFATTLDLSAYTDTGYSTLLNLDARQTDDAGNTGSSTALGLRKDTVAPTPQTATSWTVSPALTATFIETTDTTPTLAYNNGTDGSGSGVASVVLNLYSGAGCTGGLTPTTASLSTHTFSPLTEGTYSVALRSVDYANNTSGQGTCFGTNLIIDTTAPNAATSLSFNSGTSPTSDTTPTVTWTDSIATDVVHYNVKIYNDGSCTSLDEIIPTVATGTQTATLPAKPTGTYSIVVEAVDNANNATDSACSNSVDIDAQSPVLDTIADETVSEQTAITQVNAGDGGDDFDGSGSILTYSCTFDTTVDGAVSAGSNCTTLPGATFSSITGVLDWTPDYTATGAGSTAYEFKIVATENLILRTDDEIFVITVNNNNQQPDIAQPSHQLLEEGGTLSHDFDNSATGNDTDLDGETITYSCYYDTTIDQTVNDVTTCDSLTNLSFDVNTGVFNWSTIPNDAESSYEFKISITDGIDTNSKLFILNVVDSTHGIPSALVGNMKVWLQSDAKFVYANTAGTTPATLGGNVQAWRNAVPDGTNPPLLATSPTLGQAPNYGSNGFFTARPTLNWTRTNDDRLVLPDNAFYSAATEVTVILYAHKAANPGASTRFYRKGNTNRSYYLYTGASESLISFNEDSTFTTIALSSTGVTWNSGESRCLILEISATDHRLYEGNTLLQQVASSGYLQTTDPLEIGSHATNGALDGAIAELIILDVAGLAGAQRNQICTRLSAKYD